VIIAAQQGGAQFFSAIRQCHVLLARIDLNVPVGIVVDWQPSFLIYALGPGSAGVDLPPERRPQSAARDPQRPLARALSCKRYDSNL